MMKIKKDKDDGWNLITKKSKTYFSFDKWWWDWALPLHVDIDTWDKGYYCIRLHILCFNFHYTKITHKCAKELDAMFDEGVEND